MATVLVVGVGALGSATAKLLVDKVDTLILQDFDIVQERNLARQALYTKTDVGKHKVAAAKQHLNGSRARIETRTAPFSGNSSIDGVDLIMDGTDGLHIRLVLNDMAKRAGIPLVIGTASKTTGMAFTVTDACWQCVTRGKTATDTCDDGISSETIRAIAETQAMMATQALKGNPAEELVVLRGQREKKLIVKRNPACQACQDSYVFLNAPYELEFCTSSTRILARPTSPRTLELNSLRKDAAKDYGSAVLCHVAEGIALVHQHGLIEFEQVEERIAKEFVQRVCEEIHSHVH